MRKIKFRGKDADGVIHYGGYCEDISGIPIIIDEYGDDFKVFSESVAQLVGYDADNAEVYEGDVLVNDSGGEFQASFKSVINSLNNSCYCRYLENLKHRKYYRLKG